MKLHVLVVAGVGALGACAHTAPLPTAPPQTQERLLRIMERMRADSAAAATVPATTARAIIVTEPAVDGSFSAGIDVSKFEFPVQYNERVQEYIDLYAHRRRSVFVTWLRRLGRYKLFIQERLIARGLPRELVYLPLIESGYETGAISSQSAVGIWQFMSGTARAEGLEVSEWVDERRDPFRSTDAALQHLAGLYNHFGSWYLAAAAYNSGSGRISRLLKEFGRSKGPDETFWEIQDVLPQETRGYVPGLIAAAIIGEYPHLFGFGDVVFDDPVRFETVTVPPGTDLRAVARAAGVPADVVRGLNPQYFRGMTPPDRETSVRIPPAAATSFAAEFARIPAAERTRPTARTHIVQPGETLSGIAARHGTTVEALQKANRIARPHAIAAGRRLKIPL